MEEVLMIVGVRSTIIAEATPIHISPKTLEGMSDRKHHGTGEKQSSSCKWSINKLEREREKETRAEMYYILY